MALGSVIPSSSEYSRKGFLSQVFTEMQIPGHPGAQAPNRTLPALDQFGESLRIIVHLHPPHRLLVRRREQRGE